MLDEHDKGLYAIEIIREVIENLHRKYDEMQAETNLAETNFETGVMTGYRHAYEMLENRAYGLVLPDPAESENGESSDG